MLKQREMAMGRGGSPGSDLLARRKLVEGGSEVLKPEQKGCVPVLVMEKKSE